MPAEQQLLQPNNPLNIWAERLTADGVVAIVSDLSGGLDVNTPLPILGPGFSPDMDGFVCRRGIIETDYGIAEIDPDASFADDTDPGYKYPIHVSFIQAGATDVQLMLTNKSVYRLTASGNTRSWEKVPLDGNSDGITLNGDVDIPPTWAVDPAQNRIIFTNGVDTPFHFDGTDLHVIGELETEFTSFTARVVAFWNNLLIFCDTTENSVRRRYRMRRSDTGNITEWSAGNAGFIDFLDLPERIIAAQAIGPYLALYREHSIIRVAWEGSAFRLFDTRTVLSADGPVSPRLVSQLYDQHIFVGMHGIYRYTGDFHVELLSERVSDFVQSRIRTTDVRKLSSFIDIGQRTVGFLFPNEDVTPQITEVLTLYVPDNQRRPPVWGKRVLDQVIYSTGDYGESPAATAWDDFDAGETWASVSATWASYYISARTEVLPALIANSDTQELYTYSVLAPLGVTASDREWKYVTRIHYIHDRDIRLQGVFLLYESAQDVSVDILGDNVGQTIVFEGTGGVAVSRVRYINLSVLDVQFCFRGRGAAKILGYGFSYAQSGYMVETR